MRDECKDAANNAAGRKLNKDELSDIESKIRKAKRELARADRDAWTGKSADEQNRAAAEKVAADYKSAASDKKAQLALKVKAYDRIDNFTKTQLKDPRNNNMDAIDRYAFTDTDGRTTGRAMESQGNAIRENSYRSLVSTFEAAKRNVLGLIGNPKGEQALLAEIYHEDSSQIPDMDKDIAATAKEGAAGWEKTAGAAKEIWNRLGGNTGDIGDKWRIPQKWSARLVRKFGKDFVNDFFQEVDRSMYVNEDGTLMSDDRMRELLSKSQDTLGTGGALKSEPGTPKGTPFADKYSDSRIIYLKDSAGHLKLQRKYGAMSLYDTMLHHIDSISRDTAALEYFGPQPKEAFNLHVDKAMQADIRSGMDEDKAQARAADLKNKFDWASGATNPPVHKWMAMGADMIKDALTITKMGFSPITSGNHQSTMNMTARFNRLNNFDMEVKYLRAMVPFDHAITKQAQLFGKGMEHFRGEANHYAQDYFGPAWSKRLSSAALRFVGLPQHLEAMRNAFALTYYGKIGDMVSRFDSMKDLDAADRELLEKKGITESDWQIWKSAKQDDFGGGADTMLTPEAIDRIPDEKVLAAIPDKVSEITRNINDPTRQDSVLAKAATDARRTAILNMMGAVDDETHNAVITPTMNERYNATGRLAKARGTIQGEIAASVNQFKSVPQAQIYRNLSRGWNLPTGAARAAYIIPYVAATTVVGSIIYQINQILRGKDPDKMTNASFWLGSFLSSGASGVYANTLFDPNGTGSGSFTDKVAGPLLGTGNDMMKIADTYAHNLRTGQKTHIGSDLVSLLHNNAPVLGAWYLKAITDRLIFNQWMDYISPGYTNRVIAKANQNGQSYFAPPNKLLPQRAPDFSHAIQKSKSMMNP